MCRPGKLAPHAGRTGDLSAKGYARPSELLSTAAVIARRASDLPIADLVTRSPRTWLPIVS